MIEPTKQQKLDWEMKEFIETKLEKLFRKEADEIFTRKLKEAEEEIEGKRIEIIARVSMLAMKEIKVSDTFGRVIIEKNLLKD